MKPAWFPFIGGLGLGLFLRPFSCPPSFYPFLPLVALVLGLSHQRGEGAGWAA